MFRITAYTSKMKAGSSFVPTAISMPAFPPTKCMAKV